MTTNFDLGRFFPEKMKLNLLLYYSYQQEKTSPLYSPFDTDLYLDDMLETLPSDMERDSLASIANLVTTSSNLSFSNVKMNITSKKPMPYDPANFSFGFSRSVKDNSGNTTQYQHLSLTDLDLSDNDRERIIREIEADSTFKKETFKSWLRVKE